MNKEQFYAIIKLVSGEEIFSIVHPEEENDKTVIILENPIIIETIILPKMNVPVAKVYPWMKLPNDTIYIIPLDKIITLTESEDKTLIRLHKKYVKEQYKQSNQIDITSNMGFVSSVSDARISLENLYNSQTANSKFE